MTAAEDHRTVSIDAWFPAVPEPVSSASPFRINKAALGDESRRAQFERLMWEAPVLDLAMHVDDSLGQLNCYVRWAAQLCFGTPRDQPSQRCPMN